MSAESEYLESLIKIDSDLQKRFEHKDTAVAKRIELAAALQCNAILGDITIILGDIADSLSDIERALQTDYGVMSNPPHKLN